MPNPMLLGIGVSAVSGIAQSRAQSNAASDASAAQIQAANQARAAQTRAAQRATEMLRPYMKAGRGALWQQQNLLGLNGDQKQANAINRLQNGSQFEALRDQGFNAINQNAAATGGLRGGNNQAALAQFAPNMLQQLIQQQYQNLGGLAASGQNAATSAGGFQTTIGNAGAAAANTIGAAQAGNSIAQGNAQSGMWGGIGGAVNYGLGQAMQPAQIANPMGGMMQNPAALPGGLFQSWGF